jgi:plastocyanin
MYSVPYILMKYLILSVFLLGIFLFAAGCISDEPVAPGDKITVEFTAYIGDQAMVTSSAEKYRELLQAGKMPVPLLMVHNPVITAGSATEDDYMTIPAKVGSHPYWFLIGEYNTMAAQAVGMVKGETKTFPIYAAGTNQSGFMTNEEAEAYGFDPAQLKAGDIITYTRTVSEGGTDDTGNVTTDGNESVMVRDMLVLEVTDDGLIFQDTYDTIEMKIL